MNLGLRQIGFPPPEQRDIIRFHFAKDLPYTRRVTISLLLLLTGFLTQLVFLNVFVGVPLLVIGVGLVLVKGYDSRVRLKVFTTDPNWIEVPIDKLRELDELRVRTKQWDRDALDISNPLGFFSLFISLLLACVIAVVLGFLARSMDVAVIMLADAVIILIPLWFTGMRFILTQPNLAVKLALVLKVERAFHGMNRSGEKFRPALMLTRGDSGKTVPVDVRFSVAFPDAPEGFYGLQAQINLNIVQGRSHPYFYCVLAAKPGFGLAGFEKEVRETNHVLVEYQENEDAEVLVIRQRTTKRSGYHTNDKRCAEILKIALEAGRAVCE